MTLYIESDPDPIHTKNILEALRRVCPDPHLAVVPTNPDERPDADRKIVYVRQGVLDESCIRVWRLVNSEVPIVLRGRSPGVTVQVITEDVGGIQLVTEVKAREQPGLTRYTPPDAGQTVTSIDIVVEPSDDLNRGYWCLTADDEKVPLPLDAILAHELAHAEEVLDGIHHVGEDDEHREAAAIAAENVYRRSRGMPERWGHEAGYDLRKEKGGLIGGDCFVATAAYGSELEADVQELRSFRDDVLIPTRAGKAFFEQFHEHYYRISPTIVQAMHADPEIRELVRWALVGPIVGFLRLAQAFPRQEIEAALPEPWRGYLTSARDSFQAWADHLPLPATLDDIEPVSGAEEMRLTLQHLIFDPDRARTFVRRLVGAGQLPLSATAETREVLAQVLRARGLDERWVASITGATEGP